MAKNVNKEQTNANAIDAACRKFRERLIHAMKCNPELHGSIAVTAQITGGVVDRFRTTMDESEKCEAVPA